MTRIVSAIKRLFCGHHYAYYGLLPVGRGYVVVQVKCDACGAQRCGKSLVEL